MNAKVIALLFAILESLLLAGQITTLVSTHWTSWNLRFNWTEGRDYGRGPVNDGQLVSEGFAGLWSRCLRIYETSRREEFTAPYNCLHNYNTSNGPFQYEFGKACKMATAALCVGNAALIIVMIVMATVSAWKSSNSCVVTRVSLALLLFQGMICFAIPLMYLSGNMAELIDQLSTTYGLLRIIKMSALYYHDWAFWTQVGLIGMWTFAVSSFVIFYSSKNSCDFTRLNKAVNGQRETAEETEMEALKV